MSDSTGPVPAVHPSGQPTLEEARNAGAASALWRAGGYCAMPHPQDPAGVCTLHAGHDGRHRDWYKRDQAGAYLTWSDSDYA